MLDQENNPERVYKRKYRLVKAQNIVAARDDERQQWEEERAQMQEQLDALQDIAHCASSEPPSKRCHSTRVIPIAPTKLAKIQAYHAGKASVLLYHPWVMRLKAIKAGAYLRSAALFKVARIIIHGLAAINSTTEKARASTIGKELSIFKISIPLMAYCSTLVCPLIYDFKLILKAKQARYALTADPVFAAEGRMPILPNMEQLWNREVFPQDNLRDSTSTQPDETGKDQDILDGFGMDFTEEQGDKDAE
ncbi:hypothetical protein BT69DRAFT_1291606 [Atractiella rhizophila]|nr:hypothetical protein BT69DRAFT_1291606 [Atractiella rhizophila]